MTPIAEGVSSGLDAAIQDRRRRLWFATGALVLGVACLTVLSMAQGAVAIEPGRVLSILWDAANRGADGARDALVVLHIRLPRTVLALAIGAGLAMSGAVMQGLFRNPLADPGLVGVSAGAGLAVACAIVFADRLPTAWFDHSAFAMLPAAAFVGAMAAMLALYMIATRAGRTSIATMLLGGIALGALAGALMGLLSFISDDRQLRDITFWTLGSLGGAGWAKVGVVAPIILVALCCAPFLARGLNALSFGEAEAFHLGMPVQAVKMAAIFIIAVTVGASVAAAGIIGFVGIVAPHLLRLLVGPDHRALLPLCALLGAALLLGADILARTIVAPAELPIGILTAILGVPFFLWLLLRRNEGIDL